MSKQKEHDAFVVRLANFLRRSGDYYIVQTHVPFYELTVTKGEIDVLAIGYDVFDLYEVKGNAERNNFQTAVEQLSTARGYFGHQGSEFIYTPQKGIESLDMVVQRLNQKMKNKKKE